MAVARRTRSQTAAAALQRERRRSRSAYSTQYGASRQERAENMRANGIIPQLKDGVLTVQSQREPDTSYVVSIEPNGTPVSCGTVFDNDSPDGCLDYYYRGHGHGAGFECKHMILAKLSRPVTVVVATRHSRRNGNRVSSRAQNRPTRRSRRIESRTLRRSDRIRSQRNSLLQLSPDGKQLSQNITRAAVHQKCSSDQS